MVSETSSGTVAPHGMATGQDAAARTALRAYRAEPGIEAMPRRNLELLAVDLMAQVASLLNELRDARINPRQGAVVSLESEATWEAGQYE